VFKAVTAIAPVAPHARVLNGINERFTFRFVALCACLQVRLLRSRYVVGEWLPDAVAPAVASPFACFGAVVCCFGAVVEAKGGVAGVAAEGEEIELVAVGVLAVGADGFEVGGVEHRVCFGWRGGSGHVEWDLRVICGRVGL
jgi:hypothetical protein